jgi:hypothetical protein
MRIDLRKVTFRDDLIVVFLNVTLDVLCRLDPSREHGNASSDFAFFPAWASSAPSNPLTRRASMIIAYAFSLRSSVSMVA